MTSSARRPRLVVVVANGITGDSRVQKTAIAAARDGWEVFLVGAAAGSWIERSTLGPIEIIRVPVAATMRQRAVKVRRRRRLVIRQRFADKRALALYQAEYQTWVRRTTARMGWMRTGPSRFALLRPLAYLASYGLGVLVRIRRTIHSLRLRTLRWEQQDAVPTGDWRRDMPHLLDLDLAFGAMIEKLKPDLVHANDITMIGATAQAVARMRARGKRVAWLYDAHEYVRGVEWRTPAQASAYKALEREFIRRADAVVTVSPQIEELLRKDYRLPKAPLVVRNAPIREVGEAGGDAPSVRQACGLPANVQLLVYSGWISADRGLGTAISGLPKLPDCHLAIVVGKKSAELDSVLEKAKELRVLQRVHVVPYVAQHAVPAYLSSADLGVICSLHTLNYEISVPTKLAEYLHAGLPVVVSDLKTLSEFVVEHGVGEVFTADDPDAFADAVNRAMEHRADLVKHITSELLTELSWEQQSAGLLKLYRDISAVAPASARPDVSWTVEEPSTATAALDSDLPPSGWKSLGDTPVRLGLGPANYAGQAAAFARAICQDNPDVSAEVLMTKASVGFGFPADVYLDRSRLRNLDLQLEQVQRVIGRYTHLIADAFLPIFGNLNGDNIEGDLPALGQAGVKVALLAHGSEVRHPGRHLARHEYSLFHDAPEGMVETLTAIAERNKRVAEQSALPLFVTTPDLLHDLPTATWAPLVVDVDAWACDRPVMERKRPVILHAPSRRWTKGTQRIIPFLTALHKRGAIELKLAEGVAWADMRELVQDADIVLDQFGTGSYGTFAVEAMAAGKPVVAYLSDSFDRVMAERPPIVNATPATLRDAIESLLDDPAKAAQISAESVAYARKYHAGRSTARALECFLNS